MPSARITRRTVLYHRTRHTYLYNIPRMQTCTGVVGVVVFLITRDCTVVGKTLRPPSSSLESHFYFEFIFLPRFTFTDVLLFFVCLLHANSFGLLIRLECLICKRRRRRRNYLFSSVLCYITFVRSQSAAV